MANSIFSFCFKFDEVALIMITLVVFIGVCVCSFASRYMKGDIKYQSFFMKIILLIIAISITVSTDNLIILLITCYLSNMILVLLMIHKPMWKAAKASGIIAAKNYSLSAILMALAFIIFYVNTGKISITAIIQQDAKSIPMVMALTLMLVASMMQSAIWPFHCWLISSLNSPTPVSAIMHAGLVNGGGFILIRFTPLYSQQPLLLGLIFSIGLITALLGTLWKLMQSDVKRMLACSTMGQMGFMFVQYGLGLFPAAVAHLVCHGLFKAYLFLASSSAYQEKRFDVRETPKPLPFIYAVLCGFLGSLIFAYITDKSWLATDTTLILMLIALIAFSQLALSILQFKTLQNLPLAFISTVIAALSYGCSIQLIAWMLEPMDLTKTQPLNILHIIGIIALTLAWLIMLFLKNRVNTTQLATWFLKGYVIALNSSQPHFSTITTHRNHYRYS